MENVNIYTKLTNIQAALKAPKKQYNKFGGYNYRTCEDILEALKPELSKNNAACILSDELVLIGERYYIKATATLIDCESDACITVTGYAREEETKKGMDSSQITGASSSYARKYALNGLFAIDDTRDSDVTNNGNGGQNSTANKPKAVEPPEDDSQYNFRCECCGETLKPYPGTKGKEISVRAHAAASQKKFGKILCLSCAQKFKAEGGAIAC